MLPRQPTPTLFPYTTLFRSRSGRRWKRTEFCGSQPITLIISRASRDWLGNRISLLSCHPTARSQEHTSELQSPVHLVCRLLLEKKKHLKLDLLLYPHFKIIF